MSLPAICDRLDEFLLKGPHLRDAVPLDVAVKHEKRLLSKESLRYEHWRTHFIEGHPILN